MVDAVRRILANIEESGQEGDGVYDDLIKSLTALTEDGSSAPAAAPPAAMVVDDHESDDHEESEDLALASATSMAKPSATDGRSVRDRFGHPSRQRQRQPSIRVDVRRRSIA
ncbi:MAG: hypothetical protein R3E12_09050 [Candidatus Eisenbacteria bacterium]